jgi:hypothetical protein
MQSEAQVGLEEETCPVPDQMLGELYRASADGLAKLVEALSPAARATLAVYCFRRAHLVSTGVTIAATCEKDDLAFAGGNVGAMLYDRSRQAAQQLLSEVRPNERRKITLPSGPLGQFIPIAQDDESVVPESDDPELMFA